MFPMIKFNIYICGFLFCFSNGNKYDQGGFADWRMKIGFRHSYIFLLSVRKRLFVLQVNYKRMISKFFIYCMADAI